MCECVCVCVHARMRMCMHVYVCSCHSTCVEVREHCSGVGSSLVPSWDLGVELRLRGLDVEPFLPQSKDIIK